MAPARTPEARDPRFAEVIHRHEPAWVPVFLARAALGLSSVLVVSTAPEGVGSVALLSAVEASALLRSHGETKACARVAGTPSPGTAWAVGLGTEAPTVWPCAMTPILAGG